MNLHNQQDVKQEELCTNSAYFHWPQLFNYHMFGIKGQEMVSIFDNIYQKIGNSNLNGQDQFIIQNEEDQKSLLPKTNFPSVYKPQFQNLIKNETKRTNHQLKNHSLRINKKKIKTFALVNALSSTNADNLSCNCSNSNCLQRYCTCFHSGRDCLPTCKCQDCKNNENHQSDKEQAVLHVYRKCHRNKNIPIQDLLQLSSNYGCNCKSTQCLQKYCECFKRGKICSGLCKCKNCKNIKLEIKIDTEIKQEI